MMRHAVFGLCSESGEVGATLSEIASMNIQKLRERYPDGFDPEKSKNRKEGDI